MESPSSRPLTSEETAILTRLSSSRDSHLNDLISTAFVFMVIFGAGTLLVRVLSGPPGGAALAVLALLAAAGALWMLVSMRRGLGRVLALERMNFARDLASGRAASTTYEVADALRVEEAEDEGSAYYLKLADGRVLFLSGQYLYEYEEDGAFPCRRFTLERAPASGLFLDLLVLGPPLTPSGTLPAFTTEDHHADRVPNDGDLLDLDFESLRTKRAS